MEISMEAPQKLKIVKIVLPYDQAMPFLGVYLKESKSF
jgi:hypothetical protein